MLRNLECLSVALLIDPDGYIRRTEQALELGMSAEVAKEQAFAEFIRGIALFNDLRQGQRPVACDRGT